PRPIPAGTTAIIWAVAVCVLAAATLATLVTLLALAASPGEKAGHPGTWGGTAEFRLGEDNRVGDLLINVEKAENRDPTFTDPGFMVIRFSVQNIHPTRIFDWPGWQDRARVEDEHGNRFGPILKPGGLGLPAWHGDGKTRILPEQTYTNVLYHEY